MAVPTNDKKPNMVMMNHNAVADIACKLNESLNAAYALMEKLKSMEDVELGDIQWAIDKLKEIMRSEGANI